MCPDEKVGKNGEKSKKKEDISTFRRGEKKGLAGKNNERKEIKKRKRKK